MVTPRIPDAEFVRQFEELGAAGVASRYKMNLRGVYQRRERLETKLGRQITGPEHHLRTRQNIIHAERATLNISDGVVLVGSDLHAWPGEPSTAFRAFVKFIRKMRPASVIMNGDVIDGARISRHPPIGWEKLPTLVEEIEAAQTLLHEVTMAAPKQARLLWPLGNHDARFSTRLATVAPEYAKIHGVRLQDHFGERWEPCWSVFINPEDEPVVVKHRHKNGIHDTHNSTMWAGTHIVTGHTHALKVTPLSDYRGTRFGVNTGCLATVGGPQFKYLEDNPVNWRSGFVILTFKAGRLLWPEIVRVFDDDHVDFRGDLVKV